MTHDTTTPTAGSSSPRRQILLVCLAIGLVCLIIVCLCLTIRIGGQGRTSAVQTARPDSSASEIHRYSVDELPALASYLSDALDDGRLRIAPPVEWYVAPRDRKYLVQFVFDRTRQSPLPRITVEARDADFRQLRDVTEGSLPEFHKRFTDSLDKDTRRATKGLVLMLMIGDVPCVRYTLNMQFRDGNRVYAGERAVLVTLRNGRLYTVTLDVYVGKMETYNGDVFAVVAGLQFPEPTASDEEQPATDAPGTIVDDGKRAAEAGATSSPPPAAH